MRWFLIIIVFIILLLIFTKAEATRYPIGDANCDSSADAVDSLQILRRVSGLSNTVCFQGRTMADLDGDSELTATDALLVQRLINGLSIPSLTPNLTYRNEMIMTAVNFWISYRPDTVGPFNNLTVYWSMDYAPDVCQGYGGCAYVDGCFIGLCKAFVMGEGIDIWGYDWLQGTVLHEVGHTIGYHDCAAGVEPTIPWGLCP